MIHIPACQNLIFTERLRIYYEKVTYCLQKGYRLFTKMLQILCRKVTYSLQKDYILYRQITGCVLFAMLFFMQEQFQERNTHIHQTVCGLAEFWFLANFLCQTYQ